MIESSDGLGELKLAEQLAKAMLCSTSNHEACGFCHSCQLFEAGNHPDYHRLQPLESKKQIAVDQVRELNRFATESSQLSGKRVLVITLAEQMNTSASNALLKTLEEPPSQCCFVVITHAKSQLLPTVVSRCQQWHIAPPTLAATQQWLSDEGFDSTELGLALYAQAPLALTQFTPKDSDALTELLTLICDDDLVSVQSKIVTAVNGDPMRNLEQLSILLHMAMRHVAVPFVGLERILTPICTRWSFTQLSLAVGKLDQLRTELREHPGLNIELLLIEWLTHWQD
jgi:DNA polymerase-3 subunit delta'